MSRCIRKQAAAALAVCVAGAATLANAQAVPAVPAAEAVTGVAGICVIPIWEYAPRWSRMEAGEPFGYNSPTLEECAADCAADPMCAGNTFISYEDLGDKKNCWVKEWGPPGVATPCLPAEENQVGKTFNALIKADDCTGLTFKSEPLGCEEEKELAPGEGIPGAAEAPAAMPAETPMATAMGPIPADQIPDEMELGSLPIPFVPYADIDFSPPDVTPTSTQVVDLENGSLVELSATTCAQACIDYPAGTCNAFTWMGANPTWEVENNCFLKDLAVDDCMPPPEAVPTPGAYLIIAQTPACPMMPMEAALMPDAALTAMPPMDGVTGVEPIAADPVAAAAAPPIGFGNDGGASTTAPPPLAPPPPPLAPLDSSAGGASPNVEAGSTDAAMGVQSSVLLVAALSAVGLFLA